MQGRAAIGSEAISKGRPATGGYTGRKPPAVMLGLFYGSLQVARVLGRKGIEVYGIDKRGNQIASYSRYVRTLKAPSDEGMLVDYLIGFSRRAGTMPVLFPMSDYYVQFVMRHAHDLAGHYRFTSPGAGRTKNLVSKIHAHEVLSGLNIPTPLTIKLTKDTIGRAPDKIPLPCILKPEFHDHWLEDDEAARYIGLGNKVIYVDDYQTLQLHYARLSGFGELVAQEFIPGDSANLFYYAGYRNRAGKILAAHVSNKVRTFPDKLGSETLLRSVYRRDLLEAGGEILHKLDYTGPAGIDFKYDQRDSVFKVIEINCRLGLNDCYLAGHGIDIPSVYYNDSLGREVEPALDYPDGVTWYSFQSDLGWMRVYGKMQGATWARWLAQLLKGYDSYQVFSWSDPAPFVASLRELAARALSSYGANKKLR